MGILDRVAGAVGVKRRHDGESVSRPLKFANLEDTGTTSGGRMVRQSVGSYQQCCVDDQSRYFSTGRSQEGRTYGFETCEGASRRLGIALNRTENSQVPGQDYFGNFSLCIAPKCAEKVKVVTEYCQETKGDDRHITGYFGAGVSVYDGLYKYDYVAPQVGQSVYCPQNSTVDTSNNCVDLPKSTTSQAINILPTINPAPSINKASRTATPTPTPGANPNCDLPQTVTPIIKNWSQTIACREKVGVNPDGTSIYRSFGSYDRIDTGNSSDYLFPSCAKISCDNNRPNIENDPWFYGQDQSNPNSRGSDRYSDTRCWVSNPPNAWTYRFTPGVSAPNANPPYDCLPNTTSVKFADANTVYGGAFRFTQVDVARQKCEYGRNNATIARQIQCDAGLLPNCNKTGSISIPPALKVCNVSNVATQGLASKTAFSSIDPTPNPLAKSTQINILPTINPAVSINKPDHSSSIGIAAGLSTLATGAISTVAAYLSPTPTAVLAAAAPSGVITQVALGVGIFGGGAVAAGAGYGAYRFGSWLCSHPFQNTGGSIEDAIAFAKLAEQEAEQDAVSVAGDFETQELVVENLGAELPPPSYEEVVGN